MPRITPFARQINDFKAQLTGPARMRAFVEHAHRQRDEALAANAAILGFVPEYLTVVDGRPNANENQVKPGGTIAYLFLVSAVTLENAVDEAFQLLVRLSPVGTPPEDPHPGLYRSSFKLLVNSVERDASLEGKAIGLKDTDEVQITNLLPYARRIERGWSKQAPNGVVEVVFGALKRRYGNVLDIRFAYDRYPGFEVGKTRKGGPLRTAADRNRAARYPTIYMSVR